MKKVTMFLLAVLLIASLFVSCDTNTNAVLDEHVTVSFSTGSDGRSLGYEIENITNLKWHYSANKTNSDDLFKYGETSDTRLENFSTEIELSQGKWDFKLWANKVVNESETEVKVYEGSVTGVLITKETSPKSIVINVSPEVANVKGSIKFDGVQVSLKATNASTPSTPVYAKTATIADVDGDINLVNGTAIKDNLTPGDYVVTVKYTEVVDGTTVTYASETIIVTVWSGRTTTIKGNVSEETGSAIIEGNVQVPTQATVTKTASSGQTTVFTANVAPANNKESSKMESTTAVFEADALTDGTPYSLSVAVTNDVENGNINIGSGSTSGIAATLNLSLNNGEADVSTFNGKTVTITTYIAKGLGNNNVSVTGPIEANISGVSYDSDTGKLVFTTDHFSKYKVEVTGGTSYEAYNATSKKVYEKIDSSNTNDVTAISEAIRGDVVLILKDVELDKVLQIGQSITIDGNGHSISSTANRVIRITQPNLDVKLYDLGIISTCTATSDVRGISFDDTSSRTSLLLDGCTVSASFYAINIIPGPQNLNITIKNGTVAAGWAAINCYASESTFTIENSVLKGLNDKSESKWNDYATIVFDGNGLRDSSNIGIYGSKNIMNISNSTIYASSDSSNNQAWLAIQYGAQCDSITIDSNVKIIDSNNTDQFDNNVICPFVGLESNDKFKCSYDTHSTITKGDNSVEKLCYHGENDEEEVKVGGSHIQYEGCTTQNNS